MSAPVHAEPLGGGAEIPVECEGCGWEGTVDELLCVDDEETLWCPQCGTSGWVYK